MLIRQLVAHGKRTTFGGVSINRHFTVSVNEIKPGLTEIPTAVGAIKGDTNLNGNIHTLNDHDNKEALFLLKHDLSEQSITTPKLSQSPDDVKDISEIHLSFMYTAANAIIPKKTIEVCGSNNLESNTISGNVQGLLVEEKSSTDYHVYKLDTPLTRRFFWVEFEVVNSVFLSEMKAMGPDNFSRVVRLATGNDVHVYGGVQFGVNGIIVENIREDKLDLDVTVYQVPAS